MTGAYLVPIQYGDDSICRSDESMQTVTPK